MITQMRATVSDLLRSQVELDVHEFVPLEVNAYPCVAVGRCTAVPSDLAGVVFDISLPVYVCGRGQSDDAQEELDKHADEVWLIFGGTKQRKHNGLVLIVTTIEPSVIALAGNVNVPAYVITVQSSETTC